MIIKCYNEHHKYLLFIDVEFNQRDLVQFAGLLFQRISWNGDYQLMKSCNIYITQKVCYPFAEYTSITNNFLAENGVTLQDARELIFNDLLGNINLDDLQLISHGLKNDRLILLDNRIGLSKSDGKVVDGYCTFNAAKRILERQNHLKLEDLATECGYYLHHAHNAFSDVWAEVAVYTYLRKMEEQKKEEATNEIS